MSSVTKFKPIKTRCSAMDTYNFNLNKQKTVGHILSLTFTNSGKDLVADTDVSNPENPEEKLTVIGAFDYIEWDQEPTNPLTLQFRVSPKNRSILASTLMSRGGGSEMSIEFEIYEYDHDEGAQKYFKKFSCDGNKIKCVLTEGVEPRVADDKATDVTHPVNYEVDLSLTGKTGGEIQQLIIATSTTLKESFDFGVKA